MGPWCEGLPVGCDGGSCVLAGPCTALSVLPVLPLTMEQVEGLQSPGGVRYMYSAMREGRGGGRSQALIEQQLLPTWRQ